MRDQDHGDARRLDLLDRLPDGTPRRGVETGGELVEDGDFGGPHQRQRDGEPLLLPARQAGVLGVHLAPEAETIQQFVPIGRIAVERRVELERLPHLDLVLEPALLELRSDPLGDLEPILDRVEAEHLDRPAVGLPQTLDRLDRGGLAGAVRTDDPEGLARLDAEGDAVDHAMPSYVLLRSLTSMIAMSAPSPCADSMGGRAA